MFIYWQLFGGLRMSKGYFQFQAPQLRVMPFRNLSYEKQQPFVRLVRRIVELIALNGTTAKADIARIRQDIDDKFYDVFKLDEAERELMQQIEIVG